MICDTSVFNLDYGTLTLSVRGSGLQRLTRSEMWFGAGPAHFTGHPCRYSVSIYCPDNFDLSKERA